MSRAKRVVRAVRKVTRGLGNRSTRRDLAQAVKRRRILEPGSTRRAVRKKMPRQQLRHG